jgi:hypothetical protein
MSSAELFPAESVVITVRVGELRQMFNPMDPSPLENRDLEGKMEAFIVDWTRDVRRDVPLALEIQVDREEPGEDTRMVGAAIRTFFGHRAAEERRRFRQLMRRGRLSLLIGVVFLAVSVLAGEMIENALAGLRLGPILRESLLIGGWVAMWRPLEIFLYDWWPIRAEERLFQRLSAMAVRIECLNRV